MAKLFVGSSPFAPSGAPVTIHVWPATLAEVLAAVRGAQQEGEVISYCGHPLSARYLGVPVSRAPAPPPQDGVQFWAGIRPRNRGASVLVEDAAVTEDAFEGVFWTIQPVAQGPLQLDMEGDKKNDDVV